MSWNIIIVVALVALNAVFGLFRGWKNAGLRLFTMALAIAAAVGISVGLQAWSGFELLTWIKSIIQPGALEGVRTGIQSIIPFADTTMPILNTMFFGTSCSVLLAAFVFILTNKLSILLYHMLSGIGHTTDKLQIQQGKKKLTLTGGVVSSIFGCLIGALQGLLLSCIVFAPLSELVLGLI